MKKTKIIATLGPNSFDNSTIKTMIKEGVDCFRINLSHADIKETKKLIKSIRKVEESVDKPVSIMLDTNGPQVRLDKLKDDIELDQDKEIKIFNYPVLNSKSQISFTVGICDQLGIDDVVYLSNGEIELRVVDKSEDYVVCRVVSGGIIKSNQAVHFKDKDIELPFISSSDYEGIMLGIKTNVDFIALSNVRTDEDILEVQDLLIENDNNHLELIAKIENQTSLDNLDEILKVSDGLMVARGDLGIELSIEKLPLYEKMILNKAKEAGKIGIVATDLLKSMEEFDYPTRSEVSDIYNAIMLKADALMLSGETASGEHPIDSVREMYKIIESAEEDFNYIESLNSKMATKEVNITSSIAYSVVNSSLMLKSKCIIANTNSGYTARLISNYIPESIILGLSPNIDTIHSLTLNYGVYPILVDELKSTDNIIKMCSKIAKKRLKLEKGDSYIITGGFPINSKVTNFMKIGVIDE